MPNPTAPTESVYLALNSPTPILFFHAPCHCRILPFRLSSASDSGSGFPVVLLRPSHEHDNQGSFLHQKLAPLLTKVNFEKPFRKQRRKRYITHSVAVITLWPGMCFRHADAKLDHIVPQGYYPHPQATSRRHRLRHQTTTVVMTRTPNLSVFMPHQRLRGNKEWQRRLARFNPTIELRSATNSALNERAPLPPLSSRHSHSYPRESESTS